MFSLICVRINGWVNNGEAGDLRRNRAHYDVIVMFRDTGIRYDHEMIVTNASIHFQDNITKQKRCFILLSQ